MEQFKNTLPVPEFVKEFKILKIQTYLWHIQTKTNQGTEKAVLINWEDYALNIDKNEESFLFQLFYEFEGLYSRYLSKLGELDIKHYAKVEFLTN